VNLTPGGGIPSYSGMAILPILEVPDPRLRRVSIPVEAVTDELRTLVHRGAADTEIRRHAEQAGILPMRADGMRWVGTGATSNEEVLRVTRE